MLTKPEVNMNQVIVDAINKEVRSLIEFKYEELKQTFIKELERDKEKEFAAISLHIMNMVDIHTASDRTIITLRTENKK